MEDDGPYVPAIERTICPACEQSFVGWSLGKKWSHYLDHTYTDPIPSRFLIDKRHHVVNRKDRS